MTSSATNGLRAADWPSAAPVLVAAACFGLLAVAEIAQYVFGLRPCSLCIYQRLAYLTAGVIAVAAYVARQRTPLRTGLTAGCAALLAAGAGVAMYHVGVEHHWWGSAFCSGATAGDMSGLSLDAIKAQIAKGGEKPCDVVDWTILGQSAATWNVGLFAALAVASLSALLPQGRRP